MNKILTVLLLATSTTVIGEIPDIGGSAQTILNPAQERQLGRQSMMQIRASKQFLQDAEITDYLNQLGLRLVANSDEPSLAFEFFGIDDNSVNAFALPGGFIGVNTGLITTSQSESELAAVLCHEIAHVTQHHIARMLEGQQKDSIASFAALAIALLAARSNSQISQAAVTGVQAHAIQNQLNFTRSHEEEADRIGFEILQKSSYNVHAMPEFLVRMQRATRLLDSNAPSYLRTHPITSERIADTGNRASKYPHRLIGDSLSYQLVRNKILAEQKGPADAILFFSNALGQHGNPIAQRYGLAYALFKQNQLVKATQEINTLLKQAPAHPMIATLAGQIKRAQNNPQESLAYYQKAVQNFPQHRALIYDYVDLLLQNNQSELAVNILSEQVLLHSSDSNLYELQARSYAQLNKPFEQHYARANALASLGRIYDAIEQLEMAKKQGGSFYQQATVDSDLKELREILGENKKK